MPRFLVVVLIACALGTAMPPSVHGQEVQIAPGDTVIYHGILRAPFKNSVDVGLVRNVIYLVTVYPQTATVRFVPLNRYGRQAFDTPAEPTSDGAGMNWEIHPYTTGGHHLLASAPVGVDSAHVWVWADRAVTARAAAAREREWGIGLTFGVSYNSGYHLSPSEPAPASASTGYEGGLIFGTSGRISGVLGMGYDPRFRHGQPVVWAFAEPRVQLVRTPVARRLLELEFSFRVAHGGTNDAPDPDLFAPGLILAYHLDHRPGSRGWRAALQAQHAWFRDKTNTFQGAYSGVEYTSVTFSLSWLP